MRARGQVGRDEWRWLAVWIVVALLVTSVPYLIGVASSTPDRVFGGAVFAVEDVYAYLARMTHGADGAWLFQLPYTSEPHTGALFYLFHTLLGKLAALSGLSFPAMYHAARLVFGALLLVVLYRFVAGFSGSIAVRRIAFLLATFGGGLGWALMLAGQPDWLGSPPLDLILPEGFTFLVLYAMPHLALARTLLLAGLMLLWPAEEARADYSIRRGWWAGACWAAMTLIVPFYVLVVYAIVAAGLLATLARSIDWREVRRTGLACGVATIMPVYSVAVFATDPVFAVWSRQNQITSPHPLHYLAAYGLIGGLALASLGWAWRRGRMWRRLAVWLIVIPPLLYLPFGLQRRLVEAWQIPLSMLAAVTLVRIVLPAVRRSRPVRWLSRYPRYTPGGMQRWVLTGLLLATVPTFVLLLADQSLRAAARSAPMFRDSGELAALDWLDAQAERGDVVLAAYETGNYLPARIAARSFIGHGPETVDLAEKRALVAVFFSPGASDAWRAAFLREWVIDFVFVGPRERALGAVDFSGAPYLDLVYQGQAYRIYRVVDK